MRVRCVYKSMAAAARIYPNATIDSAFSLDDFLEIGKEYLVMGLILGEGVLDVLIDDGGAIIACPIQLFQVTESAVPKSWHFRQFLPDHRLYPYQEFVWGYYELCFTEGHYERLVEHDDQARTVYFDWKRNFVEG